MWVQTPWRGYLRSKISFFMYNTIFVYILRVPVSMKGSKGHQKSRKQRKQTGFKELAHICVLCSAIASPSLLSSSPIRVNPKKGGNGKGKSGNHDDSKVNGNPLYAETPANKTFGNNKDTGGRGKGRSNESNPNSNTPNNKGQGGKKGGGGKSFGGRARGKGVNAVEAGEEWVDEEQVHDEKDVLELCPRSFDVFLQVL